jgi:hypothetical protein
VSNLRSIFVDQNGVVDIGDLLTVLGGFGDCN